jgi:hypothetical protein
MIPPQALPQPGVAREPLLRALQLLQNIVEPRQTLPILLTRQRRAGWLDVA